MTSTSPASVNGNGRERDRIPILYLAPWVDIGGSDKGTIDWFRWLDRDRYAPSLITTQPSPNRRLGEVYPFAEEVWALPEHMAGPQFPGFIFDFLHTRRVQVVHVMNSRLAYELLPDLRCLASPPAVVVQLHVEEPDRSGYVRYVAARYANLVDGFSVSSRHLAAALSEYDVPRSKIRVIPTGVDANHEFNPERVRELEQGREPNTIRILFPGRLTEQKDPLLMVDVVRRLVASHDRVRVEVVGDGPLQEDVRRRTRELGLDRHIRFHKPTAEINRWLASSDLLLMTSTFEGVPYIAYEALAMKVPVIAPALPGNVELMSEGGGRLIEPRDDADAYASAVAELVDDDRLRSELGDAGRERVREAYTLRGMAAGHERLYDTLVLTREARAASPGEPAEQSVAAVASERHERTRRKRRPGRPPPLRFSSRPVTGTPLVSVVTPCYNHGRYLASMVEGVATQDYPAVEVVIVDDGSDDSETLEEMTRLERHGSARIIHQPRAGPSAARNRAISAAEGRYILPVDADNVLLPGAIRGLVDQLQQAGERVGYIYPAVQYFGNREYQFRPPAYNLYALLGANYADTCSLFDREIFDAGMRFAEDIALGHEDWDLALALGARDVIGEPSRSTVMLYRKQGFTRSDLVEYLRLPFSEEITDRHPELFGGHAGARGRYSGPALQVKARWNPAIAIIPSEPIDFESMGGGLLLRALSAQRCGDFELIAECVSAPRREDVVIRRIPPGLARSVAERVEEAVSVSRARYLLVARSPLELMVDPTVLERLLRDFSLDSGPRAVVLADLDDRSDCFPWSLVDRADARLDPHAVAWSRELHDQLRGTLEVTEGNDVGRLAWIISSRANLVQWRHFPAPAVTGGRRKAGPRTLTVDRRRPQTVLHAAIEAEWQARMHVTPATPAMPAHQIPRWDLSPAWMPPETALLERLVDDRSGFRPAHVGDPPPGFRVDFHLGSIQRFSPPGTARLVRRDGHYLVVPRGSPREETDEELGYLEEAPLPLFIGIERAVLHDGSETLVAATDRDPVRAIAAERSFLGFIESFPNEPVQPPGYTTTPNRPILIRWIDGAQRRHLYDAITPPFPMEGRRALGAELGGLHCEPDSSSIPVWLDSAGRISTDRYEFSAPRLAAKQLVRYAVAPLAWRGFAPTSVRVRASLRRTTESRAVPLARLESALRRPVRGRAPKLGQIERRLIGYLQPEPAPGLIELFAGRHRVLPDQILTHHPQEAANMGYVDTCSLGYIQAVAPITGKLGSQSVAVPWASRFGLAARRDA